MSRVIFLTYNEAPSGVFRSQIAGVCEYLDSISEESVKLVAFVSIRGFFKSRKQIKQMYKQVLVLPMYPKHVNWKKNQLLLKCFIRKKKTTTIICRGVFTANLAIDIGKFKKVVFDGRGAYGAEFKEYLGESHVKEDIFDIEKKAILQSDFRLAVSNQLIQHWSQDFGYTSIDHVVIPCTINAKNERIFSNKNQILQREKLGLSETDVVSIYSGSSAGWQSIQLLDDFMQNLLRSNENNCIVLMSKFDLNELESYQNFPDRIQQIWVKPDEVDDVLSCGDYGLMVREKSITNKVASPTKFAEYLFAGLKIVSSQNLGDYSNLIQENNFGLIYSDGHENFNLEKVSFKEKERLSRFALNNFTKKAHKESYLKMIK